MGDGRLSSLGMMLVINTLFVTQYMFYSISLFDIGMEGLICAYRNWYKFRQKKKNSIKIQKSQDPCLH
jgi:hypothetical protein